MRRTKFKKRAGTHFARANIVLTDDSGFDVRVTLWGELKANIELSSATTPVVVVKGAKVVSSKVRTLVPSP